MSNPATARRRIAVGILMFAAGATPMQLGAEPAQYLILRRKELHEPDFKLSFHIAWGEKAFAQKLHVQSASPVAKPAFSPWRAPEDGA